MIDSKQNQLKKGAKVSLVILLCSIVGQFISIYQTSHQLVTPLISENTIWEVSKQFVFTAFVFTLTCLVALILYFFDKFLWVIILVVLTLITSRFLFLPTS